MDPGVKVAAAMSVLITTVCMALLFWSDSGSLNQPGNRPLELRAEPGQAGTVLRPSTRPNPFALLPAQNLSPRRRPPTVLKPTAPASAPPRTPDGSAISAPRPPMASHEEQASWGTAAGVTLPELRRAGDDNPAPRTHTVVDGDTLQDLARRYLGQADRYLEIYQWNHDVLANPDVLPIGQLLRIPPRTEPRTSPGTVPDTSADTSPAQAVERPLVPVAPP